MQATTTVTITPAMMAAAFCKMTDHEQLQFFADLGQVIRTEASNWQAEMQWNALAYELLRPIRGGQPSYLAAPPEQANMARDTLMAMAAPLYLHTLRACDNALEGRRHG